MTSSEDLDFETIDDEPLSIRLAKAEDLDDLTDVAQISFPDDPEFDYRFPYRQDFPDDHRKWIRCEYEGYLAQPDKFAVLVVTVAVQSEEMYTTDKIIALAVWDMSVLKSAQHVGKVSIVTKC